MVVWVPSKRETMIYILRPRSPTGSVEWYTFLRRVLGWNRPRELQVNVPDLNLTLYLENPFQQLEAQRNAAQAADSIDDAAILKTMQEEQAVAGNIIRRCIEMLEGNPEWAQLLQNWASTKKMGLAWKRYDRLEWVHGAHEQKMYGTVGMQRSHDLELRPKQHYPTSVTLSSRRLQSSSTETAGRSNPGNSVDDTQGSSASTSAGRSPTLTEPPAVEGFLVRLTSQRGQSRQLGRMFYKRLYFSTHDQYLSFSTPANAIPPPPPRLPMTEDSSIPTAQQVRDKMPLIYAVAPFRLENGEIAWLRSGTSSTTQKAHDRDAFDEAERRVNTLLRADGFVDLCKVVTVRSVVRGSVPADQNMDEGDAVDFNEDIGGGATTTTTITGGQNQASQRHEDGATDRFDDSRTFELVLTNGLIVRLEAYNGATKREWIARLKALVRYWKLRKTADLELLNAVRQANLARLHIDEQSESYVGQFAQKWEVSQALASAELFHMCGVACCRTVAVSEICHSHVFCLVLYSWCGAARVPCCNPSYTSSPSIPSLLSRKPSKLRAPSPDVRSLVLETPAALDLPANERDSMPRATVAVPSITPKPHRCRDRLQPPGPLERDRSARLLHLQRSDHRGRPAVSRPIGRVIEFLVRRHRSSGPARAATIIPRGWRHGGYSCWWCWWGRGERWRSRRRNQKGSGRTMDVLVRRRHHDMFRHLARLAEILLHHGRQYGRPRRRRWFQPRRQPGIQHQPRTGTRIWR